MGFLSFLGGIFKPLTDSIDNLHTSTEEKLQLRNELAGIQAQANEKLVELERARLDALSKVQIAEAKSQYRITAIWRPVVSIILVLLIVAGSFGLVTLTPDIYELAKVFLGAYSAGRSFEKIGQVVKLGK